MRFSVLADFVCGFAVLDEFFFDAGKEGMIQFSQRVSQKPQRCWNVSELFTKQKRRYISSLNSWVALDLVLEIIVSLL